MSWGIDVYLDLRQQGLIRQDEQGAMPTPVQIAAAMVACADAFERNAAAVAKNVTPMAPEELRWLAAEIRDGTPAGRLAFRQTLLDIVEIKRGNRPTGGMTRFLPIEVVAMFNTGATDGNHASGSLDSPARLRNRPILHRTDNRAGSQRRFDTQVERQPLSTRSRFCPEGIRCTSSSQLGFMLAHGARRRFKAKPSRAAAKGPPALTHRRRVHSGSHVGSEGKSASPVSPKESDGGRAFGTAVAGGNFRGIPEAAIFRFDFDRRRACPQ